MGGWVERKFGGSGRGGLGSPKSTKGKGRGGGSSNKGGGGRRGRGPGGGGGSGAAADPYFSSVVLLINFDDIANVGQKVAVDESNSAHTVNWTGTVDALTASNAPAWAETTLVSSSGCKIHIPDHNDFNFAAGDFTMELYAYHTSFISDTLISRWGASPTLQFLWGHDGSPNTSNFNYSINGTGHATGSPATATSTMPLSTWTHMAISRVGNTLYHCEGGTIRKVTTGFTYSLYDPALQFTIASNNGANSFWKGQLANVRITKGVGRYAGALTDPYTIQALGPTA